MQLFNFQVTDLDKFLLVKDAQALFNKLDVKYGREEANRIASNKYGYMEHTNETH